MITSAHARYCGTLPQTPSSRRRRGWLRHGNPPGDYAKAPRCGARTRAAGCCRQPAMRNGRCRMHGGHSTGPRTAEGLTRSRRARWKHGFCSMEIRILRGAAAQTARNLAALVRVSRGIVRRRTARSSLGMGSIERNGLFAGSSSGAAGENRAVPPPSRYARHLPRRLAGEGREGAGANGDRGRRSEFEDLRSAMPPLDMRSIEQVADSAGASSGVASRPKE
jgi:hypothetical protein